MYFDMDDPEIKPREILAAIAIVLAMIAIGYLLHLQVVESVVKNAEIYNRAFKPASEEQFRYAAKTNIGDTLMFGTVIADDPVTTEHADGEYLALSVVKERYTMHTRIVTTTDSDGNTQVETETYWTWDAIDRENSRATTYTFCGVGGQVSSLGYSTKYVRTDPGPPNIRWKVYGVPEQFEATLFADLREDTIHPIAREVEVYVGTTVDEVIQDKNSDTIVTVFDVIWIIITIFVVAAFLIAENSWLDGGKDFIIQLFKKRP